MVQTIFIRLPSLLPEQPGDDGLPVEWCATDGIGRPVVQRDPLQSVLDTVGNREVVLLVPTEDVILTEVDLPIRQRAKLLQAVPFALEDQLAEDIDLLHFAIGERQADGRIPVLAVAHERMQSWLAPFRSAGIVPRAMLPDALCLPGPVDASHWSVLCEGPRSIVRTAAFEGFACDTVALPDFLGLGAASEELRLRRFMTGPASIYGMEELPVKGMETEDGLKFGLEALRLSLTEYTLNLLQGEYSARAGQEGWWRPYRFTAALLLLWILLATLVHGTNYVNLDSSVATLNEKNSEAMARLFPEIKTLVPGSEKQQLERRLKELRGGGGQDNLFHLLSALAQALQEVDNLRMQELQLREGTLYLSMTAGDIASLEQLKGAFEKQSAWQLEVQSANASSDGVQIRASLRSAG